MRIVTALEEETVYAETIFNHFKSLANKINVSFSYGVSLNKKVAKISYNHSKKRFTLKALAEGKAAVVVTYSQGSTDGSGKDISGISELFYVTVKN